MLIYSTILALSLSCSSCSALVEDLNGNHVIQKCLNKLAPEDNQVRNVAAFTCSSCSAHRGPQVVALIEDLNGNHVIQKCLDKLAPEDNQFIDNAVAANCVEVVTHRHRCCINRALDHQHVQLVNGTTYNALTLSSKTLTNLYYIV
ncbi:hypothetical protein M405DRAFT_33260 [Rhizopogon salebrosus TDB-379]|nr:hypothetical protein M405DRAFT_33260 [Rhizopogon salebrosus TDB-379]